MPAPGWYGPAIGNYAPSDAGDHLGPVTIGVLHTTEGEFRERDGDYFGHQNYPHFTVDVDTVNGKRVCRVYQHISIRKAAKALANRSGGVQTNREGCIQIEVVGKAAEPFTDDPVLVAGLKKLMRWIEGETDIPRSSSVTFKSYPASYGGTNGVRLTGRQWTRYAGWLGHQHVPENDHGDPGRIDIDKLLRVDTPAPPAPTKPPPPAPAPPPAKRKEIDMFIVLDSDGQKQFLCDVSTKRHITQHDRAVLLAAGVPYVGTETDAVNRQEFLSRLSEVTA